MIVLRVAQSSKTVALRLCRIDVSYTMTDAELVKPLTRKIKMATASR